MKNKKIWIILGAFLTVSTLLVNASNILDYFGISPNNKIREVRNNTTVTSNNQSGGVTANIININNTNNFGSMPRELNEQVKKDLELKLPTDKNKLILISALNGDAEANQFAMQIKKYLELDGRKVEGVDQVFYTSSFVGQSIEPRGDGGVEIKIGAKVAK